MNIHLAVVDGHTLIRYGLRELAAQNPEIEIVAECSSMADAWRVLQAVQPDVVTADVSLPDGDGLQLARQLRDLRNDLGIVLLTSNAEDDVMFRALETGVSAFVPKTAPLEELLTAIRHAAVAASSFTATGLAAALARRRAAQDRFALSDRERQVLHLLCDGMSIPAIAATMFISTSTAKTYVARLYEKLGAANRAQALMTAVHYGLIHCEQTVPPAPSCCRNSTGSRAGRQSLTDRHMITRPNRGLEDSAPPWVIGQARARATGRPWSSRVPIDNLALLVVSLS